MLFVKTGALHRGCVGLYCYDFGIQSKASGFWASMELILFIFGISVVFLCITLQVSDCQLITNDFLIYSKPFQGRLYHIVQKAHNTRQFHSNLSHSNWLQPIVESSNTLACQLHTKQQVAKKGNTSSLSTSQTIQLCVCVCGGGTGSSFIQTTHVVFRRRSNFQQTTPLHSERTELYLPL